MLLSLSAQSYIQLICYTKDFTLGLEFTRGLSPKPCTMVAILIDHLLHLYQLARSPYIDHLLHQGLRMLASQKHSLATTHTYH